MTPKLSPFGMIREYNNSKTLNDFDLSGSLADTNDVRKIAADNFLNEENNNNIEVSEENKKFYWKSNRTKNATLRAIEAGNKHILQKKKAQKQENMSKAQNMNRGR